MKRVSRPKAYLTCFVIVKNLFGFEWRYIDLSLVFVCLHSNIQKAFQNSEAEGKIIKLGKSIYFLVSFIICLLQGSYFPSAFP